jgi:glycosyltransferase involved in cell wall biosynthesis
MKRVLIITYYWPPSGGAGVQRWLKFIKYLPEFGWKPVILTVDPEYASYPVEDASLINEIPEGTEIIQTKSREFFTQYKKISGDNQIPYAGFANEQGPASFKQKIARFIRGNFLLPDPRKGWNRFALAAARNRIDKGDILAVITSSPPHSTQLIGLKLSKEYKLPWIADFRDPWTDIYYYRKFYPTLIAHQRNLKMERSVLNGSTRILTVSDGFRDLFLKNCTAPADKFSIIPNGYDEADWGKQESKSGDKFTITYVGTLADSYNIDAFISVLKNLMNQNCQIHLRFVGTISLSHQKAFSFLPQEQITYTGYVDHETAIEYMKNTTLLLLVIPEHDTGKGILPGKIFEYLASENQIVGIGPEDGDAATILEETNGGKMFDFNNGDGMKKYLMEQYQNFQQDKPQSGENKYTRYSRRNLTSRLAEMLDLLVKSQV